MHSQENPANPLAWSGYTPAPVDDTCTMMREAKPLTSDTASASCSASTGATPPSSLEEPARKHGPHTQTLGRSRIEQAAYMLADLLVVALGILFLVYGWLAYKYNNASRIYGSDYDRGRQMYRMSQFGPTVFPILFGAAVSGALQSITSYKIQSRGGISLCVLEQLTGSQSLYRAAMTQFKLRVANPLAFLLLLLWCLSPLGGQAALRVIYITEDTRVGPANMSTLPSFQQYQYGSVQQEAEANAVVGGPVLASILNSLQLSAQNQDIWGNVRLPSMEWLEADYSFKNTANGDWLNLALAYDIKFPSLVGLPVNNPGGDKASFYLPGSYVAVQCPVFEASPLAAFTNYTAANITGPAGDYDCSWDVAQGGTQYQIAVSRPCNSSEQRRPSNETTRPARQLVWESTTSTGNVTRAECLLTTTYVNALIGCTYNRDEFDKFSYQEDYSSLIYREAALASTCNAAQIRRTASPDGFDGNWTVLDIGTSNDASAVLNILANIFSGAQTNDTIDPIVVYMGNHANTIGAVKGGQYDTALYTAVDDRTFALLLSQLLNTIILLGTNPTAIIGNFNSYNESIPLAANLTSYNGEVVRCRAGWLAVLTVSSLAVILTGLASAVLHVLIIVPDVLDYSSITFLPNRLAPGAVTGNTFWSGSMWVRKNRHVRLVLADVTPHSDVGHVALATVGESVALLKPKRLYK